MTRATLLATAAIFVLAAPALADGGGKKLVGLADVGYNYMNFDVGPADFDVDQFHGAGSALWHWSGNWNVQGNFAFTSNHFEDVFAVDIWKIGGGAFWRDANEGLLGGEIHYQSVDAGGFADGVNIAARGELFLTEATLGAHIGYSSLGASGMDLDNWQIGAHGTYYAQRDLGLRLGIDYGSFDTNPDIEDWSFSGEVEYLIPDCTASVYGGLRFGSLDAGAGSDVDYWSIGAGLRLHLGTDGSLLQRNRSEPLRAIAAPRFLF